MDELRAQMAEIQSELDPIYRTKLPNAGCIVSTPRLSHFHGTSEHREEAAGKTRVKNRGAGPRANANDPGFQITRRYTFGKLHPSRKPSSGGSDGDGASLRGRKPLPTRHLESGWSKHSAADGRRSELNRLIFTLLRK